MKRFKILFFSMVIICFSIFTYSFISTYGEENNTLHTDIFMPSSYLEYYELNSPMDIAYTDSLTAIIENADNNKNIIIYEDGIFKKYNGSDYSFNTISQIKIINNKIVVQNKYRPYLFDYKNLSFTEIKDSDGNEIACSYFDLNNEYFISLYNSEINVYKIVSGENQDIILQKTPLIIQAKTDNCIAINMNNQIFYLSENKLNKINIDHTSTDPEEYEFSYSLPTLCNSIIADNNNLYFSSSNGVGKFDINAKTYKIIIQTNSNNTLGELNLPKGLAFKNNNILVADSGLNAITEFEKKDDEYFFNGFAITTTASAYNRLNENGKDIAYSKNKIAVFDSEKLMIIDNTKKEDNEKYTNYYFQTDLQSLGFTPSSIQYNGETVLFTDTFKAIFFNTNTHEFHRIQDTDNIYTYLNPISSCYAGGYFYILAKPNGAKNVVLKIDENDFTIEEIIIKEKTYKTDLITTDIDGYVYITSENKVYKYSNKGIARGIIQEFTLSETPLKICADLDGNIYALENSNTLEYIKNNTLVKKNLAFSENLPKNIVTKSFTMSFDTEKLYFLFNDNGLILTTNEAENENINNIKIPEDIKFTDTTAYDTENLKIYTVKEGENLYKLIKEKEEYKFNHIEKATLNEYVLGGETKNFYILLYKDIYLVKKIHTDIVETQTETDLENGFITTSVNLYYYPLFTSEYVLKDFTRLSKNTALSIKNKLTFNNNSFYFVSLIIDNNTFSGYVPIEFITEKLLQQTSQKNYKYLKIKKESNIYSDSNMNNVAIKITDLAYYKITNLNEAISLVEYKKDNATFYGYVYNKDFITSSNSLKNSVIVIIVALSITITSIFFIFKKRRNN